MYRKWYPDCFAHSGQTVANRGLSGPVPTGTNQYRRAGHPWYSLDLSARLYHSVQFRTVWSITLSNPHLTVRYRPVVDRSATCCTSWCIGQSRSIRTVLAKTLLKPHGSCPLPTDCSPPYSVPQLVNPCSLGQSGQFLSWSSLAVDRVGPICYPWYSVQSVQFGTNRSI